ncbi:MAG: NAD(P)H-binding protein [Candidatus Lokiarchaeota archaeon]|nr:NAD(P)H-binding protein [Candidatus Lokiarchaeota archaeon]
MKVFIVGGTGFLGYYSTLEFLQRGHEVTTISLPDIELGEWFPKDKVEVKYGNVFKMSHEELVDLFSGYDGMVYAVGPDDRVTPEGSAYKFFHDRLVLSSTKVVKAAKDAGVKKCAVLNSYFAYFDRLWPEKKLAEHHPYIKCRIEQAESVIVVGGNSMDVSVLELPYIFGTMPERVPLWKDILFERLRKMKIVLFPKGGTNMITVEHIAEAVVGAIEQGEHGKRYPIGDANLSWKEMINIITETMGKKKKIITIPTCLGTLYGKILKRKDEKEGKEAGLDYAYLFKDIQSQELYFDPTPSVEALGYKRGGIEDAIKKTVYRCYPDLKQDQ